jgi:hypothetical protein
MSVGAILTHTKNREVFDAGGKPMALFEYGAQRLKCSAVNFLYCAAALADQYGPVSGTPWEEKEASVKSPDLEQANAILDKAGWIKGADDIRVKTASKPRSR